VRQNNVLENSDRILSERLRFCQTDPGSYDWFRVRNHKGNDASNPTQSQQPLDGAIRVRTNPGRRVLTGFVDQRA
jgi:hypothetical protein